MGFAHSSSRDNVTELYARQARGSNVFVPRVHQFTTYKHTLYGGKENEIYASCDTPTI